MTAYQRIYAAVRRIPRGQVSTYGRIAVIAKASGPRQVGYALHALPAGADVPWHRVVNSQGRISLAGASAITQRLMLIGEGVPVDASGRVLLANLGRVPTAAKRSTKP